MTAEPPLHVESRAPEPADLVAMVSTGSPDRAAAVRRAGKGARGDWVKSHFGKFVGILEDFLTMQAADPGFDPGGRSSPLHPAAPDVASGAMIEDRITARVADLCNGLYEVMLQVLSRYYVHHGQTPAELETRTRTAKHLMNWVLRPLGSVLTTLPIGPSRPGCTVGPAFEIARPAYFVLPHRESAWKIITERLDVLTETCAALVQGPGLSALGDLAAKLHSMAGDVRKHLDERASAPSRPV